MCSAAACKMQAKKCYIVSLQIVTCKEHKKRGTQEASSMKNKCSFSVLNWFKNVINDLTVMLMWSSELVLLAPELVLQVRAIV